jgi:hypothetical protein
MAAPRGKAVVTAPTEKPKEGEKELPIVESVGLAPSGRGWVVVTLTTQGDRVIDREVVSVDPEPKAYAARRAMQEVIKQFVVPERGPKQ